MMFVSRMKESPAMRKLGRNRAAMAAVGVISLYLLLFVWITGMQVVSWVGVRTDTFDLSQRPIMGALLTQRTLERVAGSNQPGFGLIAKPSDRIEQVKFYFDRAGKIFIELDQQKEAAGNDGDTSDERSVEEIVAFSSLAERHVANVPMDELRAIHTKGMDLFAEQDTLRELRATVPQILIALEKLAEYKALHEKVDSLSEDDIEILYDDLALTLDEVLELVAEYTAIITDPNDLLVQVDISGIQDAMDGLYDLEPMSPIYDQAAIDQIQAGAQSAGAGINDAINVKLADIEPVLSELYPLPTGVKGMVYKFRMMLGTDQQGRSILLRALYSAKIAIQVGLIVSFVAVLFGSIIGAAAGYFGGFIDHLVIWLYSTFSSIPYLVLLVVLSFMFTGSPLEKTLIPLYVAFSLTFWIGPCRVTRGEALKLKSLDYVQAAQALGASKTRILLKHIIPNTSHLMFINSSLLFIGAIKGEVVLTYLGLGLKEGASWGIMISQSNTEIVSGFFWQIGAATFFMFVLVLAFNIMTDALQDAFDPKHVG